MTFTRNGPQDPSAPSPRRSPRRPPREYDAVVLAGGGARRLGGVDKPAVTVGGRTLLDRVLSACADASATVVVGPRRPTCRAVVWAREEPRGGGPLAALSAGLAHTSGETVLVLSADLPFLRPATVGTLLAAAGAGEPGAGGGAAVAGATSAAGGERAGHTTESGEIPEAGPGGEAAERPGSGTRPGEESGIGGEAEGAVVNDGRDQPLLAVYRAEPLRRELALLHTEYGGLSGLPLRLLLPRLRLRRVPAETTGTRGAVGSAGFGKNDGDTSVPSAALDCDTWEDVAAARARIREHGTVLDEWMAAVKAELGIELDVDTAALLDLARDAAHGVARPAAPLTTFLVGYAAAARGGSAADVAETARKAADLAARWAAEETQDGDASDG